MKPTQLTWAYLIHLGYNMWEDRDVARREWRVARAHVRCDKPLWDELTAALARAGGNMLIIDLGEAVQYRSHPELAAQGAWSAEELRRELARLRGMGLEPIPKLNFSAAHDAWLGPYARMLGTDPYYRVCAELIAEVVELFDRPRLFHLGMDEETFQHQAQCAIAIVRQHELWWHDLHYLVEQVQRHNVRAWVWSDYLWNHREEFLKLMPRSVLQSNWYYRQDFGPEDPRVRAYLDLDEHGFEQVPTGSNFYHLDNFARTVNYCSQHLAPERLLGFVQTPWHKTMPEYREHHLKAVQTIEEARTALSPPLA